MPPACEVRGEGHALVERRKSEQVSDLRIEELQLNAVDLWIVQQRPVTKHSMDKEESKAVACGYFR